MESNGASSALSIILLLFFNTYNVVGQNASLTVSAEDPLSEGYQQTAKSNFTEFTKSNEYASEEHTVTTEDGYILTMFRIPKGKHCHRPGRQPPVLLMHGLLVNSDSWLDAGPSAGLAFLLSDACYDIWLGNVRGCNYGRRNVRLNPDTDSEFWDFTSHEMGKFDVPASINYILNKTLSPDLIYIGYSQGARLLYITCSETNGICGKVRLFINLAPAVRLLYTRSITLRLFTMFYQFILPVLKKPQMLEVLPKGGFVQTLGSYICTDYIFAASLCKTILSIIDSNDPGSVATRTVRVLYGDAPAGTSARSVAFYGQGSSTTFNKYDYGSVKNLEVYGSKEPPQYRLNRTTVPVVLIYGNNDFLVDPRDVNWLATQLPNVEELYKVQRPTWNHVDYIYSQFTKLYIFPKVNQYLLKYTKASSNRISN